MFIEKESLKKYIPFIGTTLIILGYLKLSFYYNHFGIEIINYLEFSEILTVFLPDVVKNGLILFVVFIFNFIVTSEGESNWEQNMRDKIITNKSFRIRIKLIYKLNKELTWFSIIIIILNIVLYLWKGEVGNIMSVLLVLPILFLLMIIMFEFKYKYNLIYGEVLNPSLNNYVWILVLFSINTFIFTIGEIKLTEKNKDKIISFSYFERNIETNESLLYIGQTNKYLFLNDKGKKESLVFERDKIKYFRVSQEIK